MIKEGQKLPSFKLKNQKDEEVKFPTKEDTVIYFYPKADTPGCTKESCDFQSNLRKLNNLKVRVYGISKDTVQKQNKFAEKYKLKFDLLNLKNIANNFDEYNSSNNLLNPSFSICFHLLHNFQ